MQVQIDVCYIILLESPKPHDQSAILKAIANCEVTSMLNWASYESKDVLIQEAVIPFSHTGQIRTWSRPIIAAALGAS